MLLEGSMIELWGNNADSLSGWTFVHNTIPKLVTDGHICEVSDECFKIMGKYIDGNNSVNDGVIESCAIYTDTISTLGYNNIQLKFYAKSINNNLHVCKARYKMGNDSNQSWQTLWNGKGSFNDYIVVNIGNIVYDNSEMLFIRFENKDVTNPCYIDNIRIYGTPIDSNARVSYKKFAVRYTAFITIIIGGVCCLCSIYTACMVYYCIKRKKKQKMDEQHIRNSISNDNNNDAIPPQNESNADSDIKSKIASAIISEIKESINADVHQCTGENEGSIKDTHIIYTDTITNGNTIQKRGEQSIIITNTNNIETDIGNV